ncbi:MAG: FAD-dependent oxidoreductase [Deltaproteobacteria bacterium]|nr:FAD-dependent oxidoreductase [Deltaproteobacteria bacterium]
MASETTDMVSETTTGPAPVPTQVQWVEDYPGVRRARAEHARPTNEDELRAVLSWAARAGRTITLRGGGQCLHGQSVGDDLVVDLSAFDRIAVDTASGVLVAGAGARWSDVHAALPPGWVLPNLVTTGAASVGGTLIADSASRFSSAFGTEADGVRRARLVTADGSIIACDREGPHAALFRGLPGSVGLLGVLTSVEHRLIDLRHLAAADGSLRVRTVARKHPDARSLLADLALELHEPPSTRAPRGAYGLLIPGGAALLFHSMYTHAPRARRMPNHRRKDALRVLLERALRVPTVNRAVWRGIFAHYYADGDHFVDDAADFAFFMDARTTARGPAQLLGLTSALVQQVIELPFVGTVGACRDVGALIDRCAGLCLRHAIEPMGWDVLPVRGDPPMRSHTLRLSTTIALGETDDEGKAAALFAAQASAALDHGGRVLPGKGVYADTATLAASCKEQLVALARLKEQWDPSGLFGGPFYRDVLRPAMQRASRASAGTTTDRVVDAELGGPS